MQIFLLIFYAPRACPASVCVRVCVCVLVVVFCSYCFPSCSPSASSTFSRVCVFFFFVSCFLTVSRGVSFGWWPRFSQDMKRCTAPGVDHGRAGLGLGLGLVRGLVRGSRCHMWSRQDFAFDLGSIQDPRAGCASFPPPPALRIDYRRFFNSIQQWYKWRKKPHPTPEQPKMHKVDWVHDKKKK